MLQCIIPLDQVSALIREVMRPYTGGLADVADIRPFIMAELDLIIMNSAHYPESHTPADLHDMHVPYNIGVELCAKLKTLLTNRLREAVGPIRDNHRYEYVIHGEHSTELELVFKDLGDYRLSQRERQDNLRQEEDSSYGDFVPERMRNSSTYWS